MTYELEAGNGETMGHHHVLNLKPYLLREPGHRPDNPDSESAPDRGSMTWVDHVEFHGEMLGCGGFQRRLELGSWEHQ